MHHMTMNVRQTTINSVLSKSQTLVIDSQQVKNGRMEIVTIGFSFGGLVAPLVTLAIT